MNQFFHEALRLYPLAPALGGECTNSIDITTQDGSKHTLPKGTAVVFLNMALQRMQLKRKEGSSSAASTGNEIRLDLWDGNKHSKSEQPFLHTFQNGPHSCPGKPLSLLEGRVFLLLIVMQYEFEFPT